MQGRTRSQEETTSGLIYIFFGGLAQSCLVACHVMVRIQIAWPFMNGTARLAWLAVHAKQISSVYRKFRSRGHACGAFCCNSALESCAFLLHLASVLCAEHIALYNVRDTYARASVDKYTYLHLLFGSACAAHLDSAQNSAGCC